MIIQEVGGPGIDNALPGFGGPVDPGYGRPIYHPGHPDHGLPSYGHPDQGLPGGGGHPSQGLPGGGHISNRPPGSGGGGLPSHPIYTPPAGTKPTPPGVSPGAGLWVVAYVPGKGFQWVSVTPGVPEKPQPTPPGGTIDNTLPTVPVDPNAPTAGQPLPETPAPKA
jgi:hypothetical protein